MRPLRRFSFLAQKKNFLSRPGSLPVRRFSERGSSPNRATISMNWGPFQFNNFTLPDAFILATGVAVFSGLFVLIVKKAGPFDQIFIDFLGADRLLENGHKKHDVTKYGGPFNYDGPILDIFPDEQSPESKDDLLERIKNAQKEIVIFSLSKGLYVRDESEAELSKAFEKKTLEIPVTMFLSHPGAFSRNDRYRIEPSSISVYKHALESYQKDLGKFLRLKEQKKHSPGLFTTQTAGLNVYMCNFPCPTTIEKIDDVIRIEFLGVYKSGRNSPVIVFKKGSKYYDYFNDQLQTLMDISNGIKETNKEDHIIIEPLENKHVQGKYDTTSFGDFISREASYFKV